MVFDSLFGNGKMELELVKHAFTPGELAALRRTARRDGLLLATTEKDAARLPASDPEDAPAILPVTLRFADEAAASALLTAAIGRRAADRRS